MLISEMKNKVETKTLKKRAYFFQILVDKTNLDT